MKTNDLLKMQLQYFAKDEEAGESDQGEGMQEQADESTEAVKKLTQEEIDEIVEARVARERKELQKQIEDIKEEQRLSQLSENERKEAEEAKRLADIEAREQAIARKELLADTTSELAQRGLPVTFSEFLATGTNEETLEHINSFEQAWNKAVQAEVKRQLSGSTPKAFPGRPSTTTMTKEEILAIENAEERIKAIRENPELF